MLEFTKADKERMIEETLRGELVLWLSSMRGDQINLSPSWFVWHDSAIAIFTNPNNPGFQHLRATPNVMIGIATSNLGVSAVLIEGRAEFPEETEMQGEHAAFVEKYDGFFKVSGRSIKALLTEQPLGVRIVPSRIINWPPKGFGEFHT